jgi:hypothetical protein
MATRRYMDTDIERQTTKKRRRSTAVAMIRYEQKKPDKPLIQLAKVGPKVRKGGCRFRGIRGTIWRGKLKRHSLDGTSRNWIYVMVRCPFMAIHL